MPWRTGPGIEFPGIDCARMRVARLGLLLLIAVAATPQAAAAQSEDDRAVLQSTRSLRCSFSRAAFLQPPWIDTDRPSLEDGDEDLRFQIDAIDHAGNRARMIGNAASVDIILIRGADGLSFIERTPSGGVNLTTVYAWRDSDGGFKTVYSRHTAVVGPSPQQLYGRCEPWD